LAWQIWGLIIGFMEARQVGWTQLSLGIKAWQVGCRWLLSPPLALAARAAPQNALPAGQREPP
jgi:hypothetical protein